MLKFKDAEQLAFYMIDKLDDYDSATAFMGRDDAVDLMKEFLEIDDHLQLMFVDIDSYEYDKEYLVTIYYNAHHKAYELSVEKAYNYSKEKYFSTDGFVLFQNIKNSKDAMIDMMMNPYGDIDGYDCFVICGENHEMSENKKKDKPSHVTKPQSPKKSSSKEEPCSEKNSSPDKNSSCKRKPPTFTVGKKKHCKSSDDDFDFDLDFENEEEYEIKEDEAIGLFDKMEQKLQEVNDMFGEMEHFRKLLRW